MRRIVDNLPASERTETESVATASAIALALDEDIVFGRLAPGTSLREERLLERFGGSRHVIREALVQLESTGMIVRARHRGAMVRALSADDARDIHEVREMLQRQAALRIHLPVREADIAPIAALEAEYEAAVSDGDAVGMHVANDRFHDALFALCGNRQLQSLIRQQLRLSYLVRVSEASDAEAQARVIGEHRMMIGLLRGADNWALAELCVAHIRPRRDAYLAYLEAKSVSDRESVVSRAAR